MFIASQKGVFGAVLIFVVKELLRLNNRFVYCIVFNKIIASESYKNKLFVQ